MYVFGPKLSVAFVELGKSLMSNTGIYWRLIMNFVYAYRAMCWHVIGKTWYQRCFIDELPHQNFIVYKVCFYDRQG